MPALELDRRLYYSIMLHAVELPRPPPAPPPPSPTSSSFGAYGSRPHLVFHLVDDWGWNSWPGTPDGVPRAMLPQIDDLLVRNGLTLSQHYATRSCAPSRRALLSGRFINAVGDHNHDCPGLPLGVTTLPERLKAAGYATHLLGKWHGTLHGHCAPQQAHDHRTQQQALPYGHCARRPCSLCRPYGQSQTSLIR